MVVSHEISPLEVFPVIEGGSRTDLFLSLGYGGSGAHTRLPHCG
jgi:hypothetical protein